MVYGYLNQNKFVLSLESMKNYFQNICTYFYNCIAEKMQYQISSMINNFEPFKFIPLSINLRNICMSSLCLVPGLEYMT